MPEFEIGIDLETGESSVGIFLSFGPMAVGGSVRFLLLRESVVTGMIGIVFLGSLLFAPSCLAGSLGVGQLNGSSVLRFSGFRIPR